ncbi:MAG: AbrB/MazE/SpoVT family DNA-binding domain-containing protein [Acidobacteria bacterium]|nr:AbrB/MazE/SpoVT family DNA-binding domain-containing protein [Acidobacteriota bacterium]
MPSPFRDQAKIKVGDVVEVRAVGRGITVKRAKAADQKKFGRVRATRTVRASRAPATTLQRPARAR